MLDRTVSPDAASRPLPSSPLQTARPHEYEATHRIGHFFGIDLLRGLAACTILIWHYQHFYLVISADEGRTTALDRSLQPFYGLLFPFYEYGFWAVQAFWTISGFVFAHVYAGRATTAAEFATARFARLYPLHFITLLAITAIQSVSFSATGHYQLVASNDPIGFVQQLLFVSAWGFPGGNNFNGPIWSVSIEIAIYAAFFLIARRIFSFGFLIPAVIAFVCFQIVNNQSPVNNFALCGFFFFLGTCLYLWLVKFSGRPLLILAPCAACYGVFAYLIGMGFLPHMRFFNIALFLIVPSILLVGWLDHAHSFQRGIKPLRWIGDTTYSIYLWHFPIQMAILTAIEYFGLERAAFHNPLGLIFWIGGILAVGHFSFRTLERPLQVRVKAALRRLFARFVHRGVPLLVDPHHEVLAPRYRRAIG